MRKSRKLISLLLAVVLTLSCFACLSSVSAFATEGDTLKGADPVIRSQRRRYCCEIRKRYL